MTLHCEGLAVQYISLTTKFVSFQTNYICRPNRKFENLMDRAIIFVCSVCVLRR
mgnify:FL=1